MHRFNYSEFLGKLNDSHLEKLQEERRKVFAEINKLAEKRLIAAFNHPYPPRYSKEYLELQKKQEDLYYAYVEYQTKTLFYLTVGNTVKKFGRPPFEIHFTDKGKIYALENTYHDYEEYVDIVFYDSIEEFLKDFPLPNFKEN